MTRAPGSGSLTLWIGAIVMLAVATGTALYVIGIPVEERSTVAEAGLLPEETVVAPEPASPSPSPLPRVDELRHDPNGMVVVAGRGTPHSDVVLRLDGSEFARTAADASGAFATIAILGPSDAARLLTLVEIDASGRETASPDELILAPVRASVVDARVATSDVAEGRKTLSLLDAADRDIGDRIEAAAPAQARLVESEEDEALASPLEDPDPPAATGRSDPQLAIQAGNLAPEARAAKTGQDDNRPDSGFDPQPTAATELEFEAASLSPAAPPPQEPAIPSAPSDMEIAPRRVSSAPVAATAQGSSPLQTTMAADVPAATATIAGLQPAPRTDESGSQGQSLPQDRPARATARPGADSATPDARPSDVAGQVAILRSNAQGVDVLRPAGARPEAMRQVALDSISYGEAGDVQLQGRAQNVAREVRIYLDNRPVAALDVSASGSWRGALPSVDAGVYTLRIDEIDAAGRVTSRVETPFQREAPEVLAAATRNTTARVSAVTVQKGDTLWAISRDRYGEGILYVRVFEANRENIRDPDLIYPGQIFTLPAD